MRETTKVLIVCTNHSQYPHKSHKTGLWLSELTHFVEIMEKRGFAYDLVSPKGGEVPIDEKSLDLKDTTNRKYYENPDFRLRLADTLRPDQVKSGDYGIIYFAGGHGTMWDFPENTELQTLTRQIYENGGMVAAVCHGVAALLNVQLSDGTYLIEDKRVTGFSNIEERLVGLADEVPFSLEDQLVKRKAEYHKALIPFTRYIEVGERLVTGQNPQSTQKVAVKVLEEMFEK
ncbi:MAG: type 1 glutamine amidotransferase domain-containing protein [Runella sp.]